MLFLFIAYLLWVNRFAFAQSVADEHDRLLFQWQVVDPRARRLHSEVVLVLDVDLAVGHARHLRVLGVNIRVIFFNLQNITYRVRRLTSFPCFRRIPHYSKEKKTLLALYFLG